MKRHQISIGPALFLLFLLTSLTFAQSLPMGTPESLGMSPERLERLHRVMQEAVDAEKVAGIVTLVIRRGEVADIASYGQLYREKNIPMMKDAIFRIASQSKAITSVAIMILHE